jgi:transcriptional regulator with XRE-family HTH domain
MAELQKQEISKRIQQARREAGLTQVQLAELIDTGGRAVQNYENPNHPTVPWKLLSKIAMATGRSERWLLHGDDSYEPSERILMRLAELEHKLDLLLNHASAGETVTDLAEAVDRARPGAGTEPQPK